MRVTAPTTVPITTVMAAITAQRECSVGKASNSPLTAFTVARALLQPECCHYSFDLLLCIVPGIRPLAVVRRGAIANAGAVGHWDFIPRHVESESTHTTKRARTCLLL